MPGHAGNFILRLFGLSNNVMPILQRNTLKELVDNWQPIDTAFNKLDNYKFNQVPDLYKDWQKFHRAFADYLDHQQYRWANVSSGTSYMYMYAIHPHEFDLHYVNAEEIDFYFVDLDQSFDDWVADQQEKLKFVCRENELQQFENFKLQYKMKPISLTAILGNDQEFLDEYTRVCTKMNIEPNVDSAIELRKGWLSVRFNK